MKYLDTETFIRIKDNCKCNVIMKEFFLTKNYDLLKENKIIERMGRAFNWTPKDPLKATYQFFECTVCDKAHSDGNELGDKK